MDEQKARNILGVEKDASFEQIKHNYKKLSLQYHPDNIKYHPEANKQKYEEIKEAYNFLEKMETKKGEQDILDSKPFATRKRKQRTSTKSSSKGKKNSRKENQEQIENERAFDDLDAFIKEKEAELKELKCNIHLKYKKDLLNPEQKGIIEASVLNAEKERLNQAFANIINRVKAFDKLKETIDNARKQLVEWNVNNLRLAFNNEGNIRLDLRGKIDVAELERLRFEIEKTMAQIKENINELNSFLIYIDSVSKKLKRIEPESDIEVLKKKYEKQKGIISASEIKIEQEKIQKKLEAKEQCVNEFRKFYEETEARVKSLYNSDLSMWEDYNNEDSLYCISEETINNMRITIENYESILKERAVAYDEFISYYEKLPKQEQEEFNSHFALDKYLDKKNRVVFEKAVYDELKEKISNYKKEKKKDQAFEEFLIFFGTKEIEMKKLYGVDLNKWRNYVVESIEEIKEVKQEIIDYEQDLKERTSAYDEFLDYYDKLPEEQKKLYESVTDIKKYIAKGSRLLYTKATYDELKEKVAKLKKEKENEYLDKIGKKDEFKKAYEKDLREKSLAYDEFMSYYNALSDEEKTIYERYTDINRYIDKNSRFLYSKDTYDKLKEKVAKFKKEQEYLKTFEEFITFFDTKEEELKKLYGKDLSKWKKYRDNRRHSAEELEKVKIEIDEYEKELEKKAKVFDEFQVYYESLSEKDKEIYEQFLTNIDSYTNKENRVLFDKKFFDDLKEKFSELKRFKEEQEKKEYNLRAKKEFITFFNEKEKLFKRLYEIDLYKWRKYSLEENSFTKEEYLNAKSEIDSLEKEKENERMSKLYNLQLALKKLDIDIADYLSYKKTNYKNVSIGDLDNYLEDFFNISYIMGLIGDLSGGTEKLNIYLKEQGKNFWALPFGEIYKNLFDLYSSICVEIAKEEKRSKKEKDESFINFRNFYQEKKRVFKELYDEELSEWDCYAKEENKGKYSKTDYDNVINKIKEEEKKLEEERMSLEYNLQVALQNVAINIAEYLDIRGKNILSVSKNELKEYLEATALLLKISTSSLGIDLLTSYLNKKKIKLVEADYNVLLNIYKTVNNDNIEEQNLYEERYKNQNL